MPLDGELVSELELHIPAQKIYQILKDQISNLPKISPLINKIEIHDGDWDTYGHGSIKTWYYTIDDKVEFYKERVEYNDEKLITSVFGLEGDVFKYYNIFDLTFHVVSKGYNQCLGIATLKYEKIDNEVPVPYKYLDLFNCLAKDIESHLKL